MYLKEKGGCQMSHIPLTTNELKERSNSLQQKKIHRFNHIMQLGEEIYRLLREEQLHIPELDKNKKQLLELDYSIYSLQKAIYQSQLNTAECPSCHSPITHDAKFCGSCGEQNPHYKIDEIVEDECRSCHAQIKPGVTYCPSCGIAHIRSEVLQYDL